MGEEKNPQAALRGIRSTVRIPQLMYERRIRTDRGSRFPPGKRQRDADRFRGHRRQLLFRRLKLVAQCRLRKKSVLMSVKANPAMRHRTLLEARTDVVAGL